MAAAPLPEYVPLHDSVAPAARPLVYLGGDYREPPVRVADFLEARGFDVHYRWWAQNFTWAEHMDILVPARCDAFVACVVSSAPHPFAGSHMLAGVARSRGIPVCTYGAAKALTTFAQPAFDDLMDLVDWLRDVTKPASPAAAST